MSESKNRQDEPCPVGPGFVSICNDPWSNGGKPTAMRFELYDAA